MSLDQIIYQPVEVHIGENGTAPFLITCEHASNQLPPGWSWPESDAWIKDTHWAYDLGAADLTRSLADELQATALLASFSRLFLDPNRPLDSPTLFRDRADGQPVHFNQNLTAAERDRRIALCYTPFHEVAYRQTRNRRGNFLLSIHSFTPQYEGLVRSLEVGVMHVDQPELAQVWCDHFCARGFQAEVDQPYSGADGFMYSANRHAHLSGRDAIMLEIRQDLLPQRKAEIIEIIHGCLSRSKVLI